MNISTRICFIRHGETSWNEVKRIQGQTDIALSETGHAQALVMAFNAAHYDFSTVYSSDLIRSSATAQMLATRRGLDVKLMPQLRERHYGIFQGCTAAEAVLKYPAAYAHYMARDLYYDFEVGESLLHFAARVAEAIDFMVRHHSGETLAVITHAGVLDIIYRKATGRPLHTPRDFVIPNCALNWFHFNGQGWHLEAWDDHRHLTKVMMESAE